MKKKILLISILFLMFVSNQFLQVNAAIDCQHEWELSYLYEPTCTRNGFKSMLCNLCFEYKKEDIPATGIHIWKDWFVSKEADCSHVGYRRRTCSYCTAEQNEEIPATGIHSWSSWKVQEKATYSSSGYKSRYCTLCREYETVDISKLSVSKTQKSVKKTIDNFFSGAKKYNTSKIKKCFVNPKKVKLFDVKKYMAKYFKETNWDLDYAITSIKVKKKTATVKVKCLYYDYYNVFLYSFDDMANYIVKNPKASSSKIDKYQYKRTIKWENKLIDYAYEDPIKKTLTIKLKKIGNTWKITTYSKAMDNVIHRNYRKSYDAYFK